VAFLKRLAKPTRDLLKRLIRNQIQIQGKLEDQGVLTAEEFEQIKKDLHARKLTEYISLYTI
jgi:hypothetical protein